MDFERKLKKKNMKDKCDRDTIHSQSSWKDSKEKEKNGRVGDSWKG